MVKFSKHKKLNSICTELMFLDNVGVSNVQTFTIKRMDLDYFEEGS